MINNLMYIELKMGYSDDDPAWIGYVSKLQKVDVNCNRKAENNSDSTKCTNFDRFFVKN